MSDPEGPRPNRRSNVPRGMARKGHAQAAVGRALQQGRSGYGIESLRPHLQDQLILKDLMRPSFPAGPRNKPEPREDD